MRPAKGFKRAVAAQLWEKFHVGPYEFAKLTDRQIKDVAFHKRDKDGAVILPHSGIVAPTKKMTLEEELAQLDMLAAILGPSIKDVEETKEKLRAKYASNS